MSNWTELHDLMLANIRVLLAGPPGCAKTARVRALAEACGRRLVVMRAAMLERVDVAGAMIPDTNAGVTRTLPLDIMHDLHTNQEPTLLFLDDLGQAPIDVQSALMRLFDSPEDGGLPSHVLIWGATNRPGDVAGVTRLSEPLRSRFGPKFEIATPGSELSNDAEVLGTWEDEVNGWCEWAMDRGAPGEIIAWHRTTASRTENSPLYAWKPSMNPAAAMPDYRAWETVIDLWENGIRSLGTISAVIGKPAAAEFLAFARLANELPTPEQVWMDPKGAPVPSDPSALFLVANILASAVKPEFVNAAITYMQRMQDEAPSGRVYSALLARDMYRRMKMALAGNKAWNRWWLSNKELFEVAA